ncbi:MAG: hypothetical protein ACUZ77_12575 [Candidatus Brocadiales bacterium]
MILEKVLKKELQFTKSSIVLMVLGFVFFLTGICLRFFKDPSPFWMAETCTDIGFGLFIVGLGDAVLLTHVKKSFSNILSFQRKAEVHNLEDILDPRYIEKDGKRTPNDDTINNIIDNLVDFLREGGGEKEILLNGTSLRDFFSPTGRFYEFFVQLITERKVLNYKTRKIEDLPTKDTKVVIKAIILDPNSDIVALKGRIESREGPENKVLQNIWISIDGYRRFLTNLTPKKGVSVQMRSTSLNPPGWFVMTNKCIFFEPYYWGIPLPEKDEKITHGGVRGLVPIFQLSKNSELYKRMKLHFNFLWDAEEEIKKSFGVQDVTLENPPEIV